MFDLSESLSQHFTESCRGKVDFSPLEHLKMVLECKKIKKSSKSLPLKRCKIFKNNILPFFLDGFFVYFFGILKIRRISRMILPINYLGLYFFFMIKSKVDVGKNSHVLGDGRLLYNES